MMCRTVVKMAAKWNNLIATAYVADQIRRRYPDLDAYGQKARVARDLDVPSPQSIGQWLTGTRQISPESFEVIATRWGLGYESMLDAAHAWAQQNPAAVGRVEMSAHLSNRAPTLDRIEGYAAAEAAARAIAPRIPDAAWARVRAMSGVARPRARPPRPRGVGA